MEILILTPEYATSKLFRETIRSKKTKHNYKAVCCGDGIVSAGLNTHLELTNKNYDLITVSEYVLSSEHFEVGDFLLPNWAEYLDHEVDPTARFLHLCGATYLVSSEPKTNSLGLYTSNSTYLYNHEIDLTAWGIEPEDRLLFDSTSAAVCEVIKELPDETKSGNKRPDVIGCCLVTRTFEQPLTKDKEPYSEHRPTLVNSTLCYLEGLSDQ